MILSDFFSSLMMFTIEFIIICGSSVFIRKSEMETFIPSCVLRVSSLGGVEERGIIVNIYVGVR
jgi:hypothetical protein